MNGVPEPTFCEVVHTLKNRLAATDLLITNQLLYQLSYASLRSDGAREDERALYSSGRSPPILAAGLRLMTLDAYGR